MHATKRNAPAESDMVHRTARYGKMGIAIGGVLCVLPIASYILFGTRGFDELHTSLPKVLLLYVVGGCVAGALVGIVMPIVRSDFMAGVVGSIIGIMAGCAIQIMDPTGSAWATDGIVTSIIFGIGVGAPSGVLSRRDANKIPGASNSKHNQE